MRKHRLSLKKLLEDQRITAEEYRQLISRGRRRFGLAVLLAAAALFAGTRVPSSLRQSGVRLMDVPLKAVEQVSRVVEQLTPDPRVISFYPQGEVEELGDMVARFSSPMIPDTSIETLAKDLPVRIEPDLGAHFLWTSPTTLKIVWERRPPPGTRVSVSFDDRLKDIQGRGLFFSAKYSFLYRPFRLKSLTVDERVTPDEGVLFHLQFSVPVSADELSRHLEILDDHKTPVPFRIPADQAITHFHRIHVLLPRLAHQRLTFVIKAGLKPHEAQTALEEDIRREFGPLDELVVQDIRFVGNRGEIYDEYDEGEDYSGAAGDQVRPAIQILFNRRIVGLEGLTGKISVNDDTRIQIAPSGGSRIQVTADFLQFGETYTVKCRAGLRSGIHESTVDVVRVIVIPAARPALALKSSGIFQSRQGQWLLPIEHLNVDTLYMTVYQIYDNNLIYFATQYDYAVSHDPLFFKIADVAYRLKGAKNARRTDHLDLKTVLKSHESGPKILKFSTNAHSFLDHRLLIMTDLGISFKQLGQTLLVLVTSLKDAAPVAGAAVQVYSRSNQLLAAGVTSADGIAKFNGVGFEHGAPHAIIVRKDEDINFLAISRGHLPTAGFDIEGDPYTQEHTVEAAVIGEREIYRPGETVRLKVLVRGKYLTPAPPMPILAVLAAPDGRKILERTIHPDDLGLADLTCSLADHAMTGVYQLTLTVPGGKVSIGGTKIQVEAFVPDRIETKVRADRPRANLAETLKFSVKGAYLFGAPAEGHRVRAMYSLTPAAFAPAAFADYRFGRSDHSFKDVFYELNENRLNDKGECDYSLTLPESLEPPAALNLVFTATVLDVGARGVSARQELTVHPYPFYIGIQPLTANPGAVPYGSTLDFKIVAVTPAGRAIPEKTLKVAVYRNEWEHSYRADERGNYRYIWEKRAAPVLESESRIENGVGHFSFKMSGWGDYVFEVSDTETKTKSSVEFGSGWDGGEGGSRVSRKLDFDRLELKLDKDLYRPGQTASVKLTAPFDGVAYLFVEGSDIQFFRRVTVSRGKASFDIPVQTSWAPNVYISAVLLSGSHRAKFGQTRAVGIAPLKVLADHKILDVALDVPSHPVPGTEHVILIHVKDRQGQAVSGEVALSIVDQGVLQLTDLAFGNPYNHFFRKRANQVTNSDLFSYLNPEPETRVIRRLTPSGDEGLRRHRLPFKMTSVVPVSEWHPRVKVVDGTAKLKWKAPDFSGKLTFRAWAVSAGGVGFQKVDREQKQPLILESSLPMAATFGDKFRAPLKVISNLNEPRRVTLRVRGDSLLAAALDTDFNLEPGGSVDVSAPVEVSAGMGMGELTVRMIHAAGHGGPSAEGDRDVKRSAAGSAAQTLKVAVRPPYPVMTESEFHPVNFGAAFEVQPPDRFIAQTARYRMILSRLPDARLLAGLDYLIQYPYGCIEQTTSSVFPQLYLKNLLKMTDPRFSRDAEIDRNIYQGINRLMSMARADGSFAYWPGAGDAYPYGSVYAAHFLAEAARAGYAVPEFQLSKIKEYLQKLAESTTADIPLRAYACYVLALTGVHNAPLAHKLLPTADGHYKYYLAAAMVMSGEADAVGGLVRANSPIVSGRTTDGVLSSDVVSEAAMLNALIEVNSGAPIVESLAAGLLKKAGHRGHWGTTHDNAQALVALGKYYQTKTREGGSGSAVLLVDGVERLRFDGQRDTFLEWDRQPKTIQIRSAGAGGFHFTLVSSGIPAESHQKYFQRGIEVVRSYYDLTGKPYGSDTFVQGQMVVIEAKIKVHQRLGNLFYEDILPAGLEPENPRMSTRAQDVPFLSEGAFQPDHIDFRDDRVVVFFSAHSPERVYTYRYLARAGARGTFRHPALSAGCMYDPDVQCIQMNRPVGVE